jgi:uncharacterized protein (TIGR00661 family)
MKILYAIQGTGNGHICRAAELIPEFEKYGEVDVLVSGTEYHLTLPWKIKYQLHGLTLVLGNHGGIDYVRTFAKNQLRRFIKEVQSLPVQDYDLVISDFEPVSAWACYMQHKDCYGIGNQFALQQRGVPLPQKRDLVGKFILNSYAPVSITYGMHFKRYNPNIRTPIIRRSVRLAEPSNSGHYTVYLCQNDETSISLVLQAFPDIRWEVFSKQCKTVYTRGNIKFFPIEESTFLESLKTCEGIICGAGFGTTSEALFLGKKLCVIPTKNQLEQKCNAVALEEMGATVLPSLQLKQYVQIHKWLEKPMPERILYPDNAATIAFELIETLLERQVSLLVC